MALPRRKKVMEQRYETAEDVRMRLSDAWVRYKGRPYFTMTVGMNVLLLNPSVSADDPVSTVNANDPDLDISSIPLGYFIHQGHVYFAERVPLRRQTQGVAMANVQLLSIEGRVIDFISREFFFSTGFRRMLEGKYPKLEDMDKVGVQPLSRNICVDFKKGFVYCNTIRVGTFDKKNNTVTLDDPHNSVLIQKLKDLNIDYAAGL